MILDYLLFFGLALVAVASALGMLFSQSAIYSALNLIMNFISVAVFYLLLGAPFIAVAQVAVYAGAIMVLFLFVIMLLGAEKLPGTPRLGWQRPLAVILAGILILEAGLILVFQPTALPGVKELSAGFGAPESAATLLFKDYLLPFEVISVLLLVAMIGAILLTRQVRRAR
jgi:NADH-quinone oxidoreductase subunit J